MTRPRRGDTYLLAHVTTTDGLLAHDVTVTCDDFRRLGCGCYRIDTTRPGPADGPHAGLMQIHVGRCGFHRANPIDGIDDEPQRVAESVAVSVEPAAEQEGLFE